VAGRLHSALLLQHGNFGKINLARIQCCLTSHGIKTDLNIVNGKVTLNGVADAFGLENIQGEHVL
jgi:hypothetical protein